MSPVDPLTLNSGTPRTTDGRSYPEHLRAYHAYDDVLLPLVAMHEPVGFDDLSVAVNDPRVRAALPRWLASAEWRALVERSDTSRRSARRYRLGSRAASSLRDAA